MIWSIKIFLLGFFILLFLLNCSFLKSGKVQSEIKKTGFSSVELESYASFEKILDPEPFQFSPWGKRARSFVILVISMLAGGLIAEYGLRFLEYFTRWREQAVINYQWRLFDFEVSSMTPVFNCFESQAELLDTLRMSAGEFGSERRLPSLEAQAPSNMHQEVGRSEIDAVDHLYWMLRAIVFIGVTLGFYRTVRHHWNDTEYLFCNILEHVIISWDEHKSIVPEEFHKEIEGLVFRYELGDIAWLSDEVFAEKVIIAWVLRCLEVRLSA